MPPKIVVIGYIWPEAQSSAAGLRDWNLIETFKQADWDVVYISPSKENSFSQKIQNRGIPVFTVQANDSHFDEFIRNQNPDFVLFDRFVTEEQFGWRVEENCPNAVRILDTQDLHFLRREREDALKNGMEIQEIAQCKFNLVSENTLRELASIYRSDCSLILSDFELNLLTQNFRIDPQLLFLSRFHYKTAPANPGFSERKDFAMIGNFRHPPNADGILWFHKEIWPLIREGLPSAKVHIYGAYPPRSFMEMTDPDTGFHVIGPVQDQFNVLRKCRINLASLRFGAGIKGKITDGWWSGVPVVTTSIGAEGMPGALAWGGKIADTAKEFAEEAIILYSDEAQWRSAQASGYEIMNSLYSEEINSKHLLEHLISVQNNTRQIRENNIIGRMLRFHLHRSTKYFSKWIEAKNLHPK